MTDGMTILAELDARDRAQEDSARKEIEVRGWTLDESIPGWVKASKGNQLIGGNTVLDVVDWIRRRGLS